MYEWPDGFFLQEYHHDNKNIIISETEMKQTVYIFKCDNCTIQVKGKVNAITMGEELVLIENID